MTLLDNLAASIDASPLSFVIADARAPDLPVVAVNRAFTRLTGYGAAEAVGRNARFLQGAESDPVARAAIRSALSEGRPIVLPIVNYRRDGIAFRNGMMVAPVIEGGVPVFFLGSQVDLGEDPQGERSARARRAVAALAPRQREVLALLACGYRNKQIAHRLGLSEKTVEMHRANLLARLGVRSAAEAIRIAVEAGL